MSSKLLGIAFAADIRPHAFKLVLLKLVDAARDDGTKIFPSVGTIAKAAGVSERHTKRVLHGFVEAGLLSITASGGHGRGDTTEYALDVALLDRLGTTTSVTFENSKGTFKTKGDTAAPSEKRVTPEAVKGDAGVTQPLRRDPLEDSRESARATGQEGPTPEVEATRPVEFLPPPIDPEAEASLSAIENAWPAGAVGNRARALGILVEFSAADRKAAAEAAPRYLRALKDEKRRYTPNVETYLANRDFERFPQPAKAAPDAEPAVELKPYVVPLWAMFWGVVDPAGKHHGPATKVEYFLSRIDKGLVTPQAAIPKTEDAKPLVSVKIGSPEYQAWTVHLERLGITLPKPDSIPVVYLPDREPPEALPMRWKGYRLAIPQRLSIRSKAWWWRLFQTNAPLAEQLSEGRRGEGAVFIEFGPWPAQSDLAGMVEIKRTDEQWDAWVSWFWANKADLRLWHESIWCPVAHPPVAIGAPIVKDEVAA